MEQILMSREDALSRQIEQAERKIIYAQRDEIVPEIHAGLRFIKNTPVVKHSKPSEPACDNYARYQINIRLPAKIDLK